MAGPCKTRKAAVAGGSSQATTDASASSRWPPVASQAAARRCSNRSSPGSSGMEASTTSRTRSLRTNQPSTVERGCRAPPGQPG